MRVRNPWRRAGILSGVAARIAILSAICGVLVAAVVVPLTGIVGVATRDAAKTFISLKVPALGQVPARSEILDSEGHLIAYFYPDNIYRIPVTYNHIAPVMRNAIVAIEDSRFYEHGALDTRGTLRALASDAQNTALQGGSTLAQQYVKNALILTAHTKDAKIAAAALTPQRKIRELRMAANVEHELTKPQLLAAYLNAAYFSNKAVGIQVASELYFHKSARKLTLTEAALLAGIVEYPSRYDPIHSPVKARQRRNVVLNRMAQLRYISDATADRDKATRLGLHVSSVPLQTGCNSRSARDSAWFCQYVLAVLSLNKAYHQVWSQLTTTGGLKIYTTMNGRDQSAAQHAVDYVEPPDSNTYNPGRNADTEVLIQPGTGRVRAIAEDRRYEGKGIGGDSVNYAVEQKYGGSAGIQTGSSSKLFTLVTALKEGIPFGYDAKVTSPASISGYSNCQGEPIVTPYALQNAEGPGKGIFTLYNATTQSINIFFAELERKVGLCKVVQTAASMGLRRADGKSLLSTDKSLGSAGDSADNNPSFTLGSGAYVTPMGMAAAYATVAARGVYCKPEAIEKIVTSGGTHLPVATASCHRALSTAVADATNHILQGVLVSPGTGAGLGIPREAAAKTGTANAGSFAAFAGYTPTLAGYVSVFNPRTQIGSGAMEGEHACYRLISGLVHCPPEMYGANAPGSTWQISFLHADLGKAVDFVAVPLDSPFYKLGTGVSSPKPVKKKKPTKGGGGGGGNGGGGGGGGPVHH